MAVGQSKTIRDLFDSLSPLGTTTHSHTNRDFPVRFALPRHGGDQPAQIVSPIGYASLRQFLTPLSLPAKFRFPETETEVRGDSFEPRYY